MKNKKTKIRMRLQFYLKLKSAALLVTCEKHITNIKEAKHDRTQTEN